jgi:hypothetical protein
VVQLLGAGQSLGHSWLFRKITNSRPDSSSLALRHFGFEYIFYSIFPCSIVEPWILCIPFISNRLYMLKNPKKIRFSNSKFPNTKVQKNDSAWMCAVVS